MSFEDHAKTDLQKKVAALMDKGFTTSDIAQRLGLDTSNCSKYIRQLRGKAALAGDSPEHGLTHPVAPGFTTRRVSTMYNAEGGVTAQWHIQEPEKQRIEEFVEEFVKSYSEDLKGLHKPQKRISKSTSDKDHMACYMIGDHHLGMYSWGEETGLDWDADKSEEALADAIDRLVSAQAGDPKYGALINLGDFFHANDTTSMTPASKALLDTDGRFGRVIRIAARLYKRIIARMLEKHEEVIVFNVRGNHDPDVSLLINELLKGFYETDKRVTVVDNYNKFLWKKWGQNLIILHHGDKINQERLYESITTNLAKEWGETSYRVCWTGHLHSKLSVDKGGLNFERWNVLPPADAWHNALGFASPEAMRTVSCVVLHREYGEEYRYKVGIRRINSKKG